MSQQMLHDLTGQMMPGAMANAYLVFSMMPAINLHFGFPSLAGFFAEAVEGGEMKADYAQVEPVLGSLIKAAASHVDTSIATTITEAKAAMDPDGAQLAKMKAEGEGSAARLAFRLNTGDLVTAGPDHPLRFAEGEDGPRPYLHVRGGLEALVARAVYYDLAERALADDAARPGVWSDGAFFPLEPAPSEPTA